MWNRFAQVAMAEMGLVGDWSGSLVQSVEVGIGNGSWAAQRRNKRWFCRAIE